MKTNILVDIANLFLREASKRERENDPVLSLEDELVWRSNHIWLNDINGNSESTDRITLETCEKCKTILHEHCEDYRDFIHSITAFDTDLAVNNCNLVVKYFGWEYAASFCQEDYEAMTVAKGLETLYQLYGFGIDANGLDQDEYFAFLGHIPNGSLYLLKVGWR